jgi:hypothetical protein
MRRLVPYVWFTLPLLLVVALMQVNPGQVDGQQRVDRAALREKWTPVWNYLNQHKNEWERTERAVRDLAGVLDYDHAIRLVGFFDVTNEAWMAHLGRRSRGEAVGPRRNPDPERPVESYRIANAILYAIREMSYPDEVAKFKDDINDTEEYSLRPRMAMLDAIARHARDHDECREILLNIAKDPNSNTDMRILTVAHLGEMANDDEVMNILLTHAIRDRSWRVRDAAIDAMVRASDFDQDRVVVALIGALAAEEGKLRGNISEALQTITGQRFGPDPDAWSDWVRDRRREAEGLPPRGARRGESTRVFNTETYSNRYVFVLDASISMVERISPDEKERLQRAMEQQEGDEREELDWSRIHNNLDLAREEIIRTLRVMDPERTRFTIIVFDERVLTWQQEMMPTTERNVNDAAQWMRALRPQNLTNVYGAISEAFDLSEKIAGADVDDRRAQRRRRPRQRDSGPAITGPHRDEALPDTIFFYSDGYATHGKYAGDDDGWRGKSQAEQGRLYAAIMRHMVAEFEERYRVSRISINCVGIGTPQDRHTMSALSRATRGEYKPLGQ